MDRAYLARCIVILHKAQTQGKSDCHSLFSVPFQPTGTNVVTNTAPTPGVRMRVVRRTGNTADVVGLGEDLQLRIEIDQDSAFGLFARQLEARTDNGELLNLIDQQGCPLNELIFPALDLESSSRALIADFKVTIIDH